MESEILKRATGIVGNCESITSKSGKKGYKVIIKGISHPYYFWKEEALHEGDEIDFEYDVREVDGKTFYTIKHIIDGSFTKMSEGAKRELEKVVNLPVENIVKLQIENDTKTRLAMLMKCVFDYGNRKNKEWDQIMSDFKTLCSIVERSRDE